MKLRYVEPSTCISITITDREPISHWGRTRPSPDRFSRQEWDRSWPCGWPEAAQSLLSLCGERPLSCRHLLARAPLPLSAELVRKVRPDQQADPSAKGNAEM